MESTSCGQNCAFVKCGFCNSEKECPNYIESWWVEGENGQPKMLKDCAPKRMLLQQQMLQSRVENMQVELCNQKARAESLAEALMQVIQACKLIVSENQKTLDEPRRKNEEIDWNSGPRCNTDGMHL